MSKDIRGNDWFGCFFSKLILSFHYYFLGTLMIVLSILFECQKKNSYSNLSKSQWVWSEVFSWKNAPCAERRCKWHQKEPNPDTLRGIY